MCTGRWTCTDERNALRSTLYTTPWSAGAASNTRLNGAKTCLCNSLRLTAEVVYLCLYRYRYLENGAMLSLSTRPHEKPRQILG